MKILQVQMQFKVDSALMFLNPKTSPIERGWSQKKCN